MGQMLGGNGEMVECNYCSQIVSGGISEFKRHLAGPIEDPESCVLVPDEIKALMKKIVAEDKEASGRKRKKVDVEQVDEEEEQ